MILQTVMLLPLSLLLFQQILIEVTALPLYQQAMVPTYAYSSIDFYSPLLGGGSMLDDGMLSPISVVRPKVVKQHFGSLAVLN